MARVAAESFFKENRSIRISVSVKVHLADLIVRFGLQRLQLNRAIKFSAGILQVLLHEQQMAKAEVCGSIIRMRHQIGAEM